MFLFDVFDYTGFLKGGFAAFFLVRRPQPKEIIE